MSDFTGAVLLACIVRSVEMCHHLPWFLVPFISLSSQGVRNVASVCLQIGYPTIASVPHSIINGYKRVLAVAVETDYTFPLAEKVING